MLNVNKLISIADVGEHYQPALLVGESLSTFLSSGHTRRRRRTCMVTDCMARLVAMGRLLLMIFTGSRRLGLML